MRKAGGVEVDAVAPGPGPVDPAREVLRRKLVALNPRVARLGVDRVEVEAVGAGNQAVGEVEVAAQLVGRARLTGIVAGRRDAAGQLRVGRLEAGDVIALPAVEAQRNAFQCCQRLLRIDAEAGVALSGE